MAAVAAAMAAAMAAASRAVSLKPHKDCVLVAMAMFMCAYGNPNDAASAATTAMLA